MSWIAGLAGAVGTGIGGIGANRTSSQMNKWFTPGNMNNQAQQMNPWVWNAIQGRGQGQGGFQGDLWKIAQGQDISPWLLNQPVNQINRSFDNNMTRMTSQLGRSNMSGGIANASMLSNMMGKQNALANTFQNYGQWREGQRRSDLNWLLGQVRGSQDQAANMMDKRQFKKGWMNIVGDMAGAFVGGTIGAGGFSRNAMSGRPTGGNNRGGGNNATPFVNSLGSQGNWGQGMNWGTPSPTRAGGGASPMWPSGGNIQTGFGGWKPNFGGAGSW